jgi:hypothetical protein
MNIKRITGIIIIVLGLFLIAFSTYAKIRIGEAKKIVHETTGAFSGNPIGKMLGSEVEKKVHQYDTIVIISLVGGVLLTILGAGMAFYFKKK